MSDLNYITLTNYLPESSKSPQNIELSYQLFGCPLQTAPVILINHALTGNANIASENEGWWRTIVGSSLLIDTNKYTVIGINIVGNIHDRNVANTISNLTIRDNAELFIKLLENIGIDQLFAIIGGSIGGAIAWEMAVIKPSITKYLIPIASGVKASDWIRGICHVQKQILETSNQPLEVARMMAMLFYRTPISLAKKFNSEVGESSIEAWLNYHGQALSERFSLQAYRIVNHLLTTIDISRGRGTVAEVLQEVKAKVIQIGVDQDLFFGAEEIRTVHQQLQLKSQVHEYHEIKSIHGHDAFLIEYDQIRKILTSVFH